MTQIALKIRQWFMARASQDKLTCEKLNSHPSSESARINVQNRGVTKTGNL